MANERPDAEKDVDDLSEDGARAEPPGSNEADGGRPSEAQASPFGAVGSGSSVPPASERPDEAPPEPKESRRNRFENILPGLIRRGIEKGIEAGIHTIERSVETGRETSDVVRGVLSEVKLPRDVANAVGRALTEAKLPRELAGAVFNQIDETKNDVLRIVAREVRDFLEATDLAGELKAALTSLSFEVRTEVRFIPNDAGTGVKPDVRARSRIKRSTADRPRDERRRARQAAKPKAKPAEKLDHDELDHDEHDES